MNEDGVRVTRIDWLTAVPSLRLCEAVRFAISLHALLPATLLLWWASNPLCQRLIAWNFTPNLIIRKQSIDPSAPQLSRLIQTLNFKVQLIATGTSLEALSSFISLAFCMLLFSVCAIPVMRSAGSRFCSAGGSNLLAGVNLALQSWKAILVSSLLSCILLCFLCVAFRTTRWIGSVTFPELTLLAALFYVVGVFVLGFGWLLSLAAIAIDRCDGSEALSRGISYVLSHWPRVIIYTFVGYALITVCQIVFGWVARRAFLTIWLADDTSSLNAFSSFDEVIRMSIFLCEFAIAYVLLRNVEDGVSLREIDGGQKFHSP